MAQAVARSRRIDGIPWALFFIWTGAAMLLDVGLAWWLLGTSAIVLGTQAALYSHGANIHGFWVSCGVVLLAWGLSELFAFEWPLVALLMLATGFAMLGSALRSTRPQ